jgi:predicted methyltransferase
MVTKKFHCFKMKKIFLFIAILFFVLQYASAQNLKSIPGHCGLYYGTMDQLNRQITEQVKFYDFQPGQTVASIGAQCANWEAAFAVKTDSIIFYLEDIDSTTLNDKQAGFTWNYYSTLSQKKITCTYKIIIGNEKSTNLPTLFFDKILIINSFHEFSDQPQMLADIAEKLKPGGVLYIDETLAKKSGELHIQCKKRIFTSEEIIEIFKKNGFQFIDGKNMDFRKSKPVRKIFAFKKS